MRKGLSVFLIVMLCVSLIAGCSAKKATEAAPKAAPAETQAKQKTAENAAAGEAGSVPLNRKLIVTVNATLRVDHMQESIIEVERLTQELGGYVKESRLDEDDVWFSLMVPAGSTDSFMERLEGVGVFISKNKMTEDVTDAYFDTQTRIKNLESEIETLRKLLQKEGWKVSEILEIEREIRRLTEELELLKGQITNLDRRIQFSQISIRLLSSGTEIKAENPDELGYKAKMAFKNGVEMLIGGFIALVSLIAFLLPIAPFIAAAYFLWKKVMKPRWRKKQGHE